MLANGMCVVCYGQRREKEELFGSLQEAVLATDSYRYRVPRLLGTSVRSWRVPKASSRDFCGDGFDAASLSGIVEKIWCSGRR